MKQMKQIKQITIILICCMFFFLSCKKNIYNNFSSDILRYQAVQNDRFKNLIISQNIDTCILSYESLLLFDKGRKQVFDTYKYTLTKMIKENKYVYAIEASYNTYSVTGCIWSGKYHIYYTLYSGEKPTVGTLKSKNTKIQNILEDEDWTYMKNKVEEWDKMELLTLSNNSSYVNLHPFICSKIEFNGLKIKDFDMLFLYEFPKPLSLPSE
jgi:hypothetical protein